MYKLFWNTISPLLLRLRWKRVKLSIFNSNELKADFKGSLPKVEIKEREPVKILIGSIRSQAHSNLFEGAIGAAFKNSGFDVSVLQCGQFLKACETKSHFKDNQMTCSMCHEEFTYFKEFFGLEAIYYEDLISEDLKNEIRNFIESIDLSSFTTWRSYNLRDEWTSAIQRYYLSSKLNLVEQPALAKSFLYTVISSFECGRRLVDLYNYTHLFTSHGIYSTWGGLIAGFREAGGNVSVWGRGYYKSGIVSFKGVPYLNGLKNYTRDDFVSKLNNDNKDEIINYLNSRWSLTNDSDLVKFYDNKKEGVLTQALQLDPSKKYLGFYPNIPWDGQVFVATKVYRGLRDVIEALLEYTNNNSQVNILVRPHPYENPKRNPNIGERFSDLAKEYNLEDHKSFTIIPHDSPITSYDVADKVQLNLLLAGTIGLEFAARGLPVVQVGKNISTNKGIFLEPDNNDELFSIFDSFFVKNNSSEIFKPDETKNRALDWATFYFKQAHIQDPFFEYKGLSMNRIKDNVNEKQLLKYMSWILFGEGLYYEE